MQSLKNKLVLITGATSGIGLRIVHALAEHRANLLLIGRNENVLKEVSGLYNKTINVTYFRADLTKDDELFELLRFIKLSSLEPDILIHCAGIFNHARIQDTSNEK